MPEPLAMFPLGSVLLPGGVLALRLFEPRYLRFIDDVLAGGRRFGVVLIERGQEVGGGEARSDVGCVAEIARATPLADGTWQVLAFGSERIDVVEWLPDDPYPRALVRPFGDDENDENDQGAEHGENDRGVADRSAANAARRWTELLDRFRTLEALLAARTGRPHDPLELSSEPAAVTFEIANALPINPYDKQRLLAARTPAARRALLLDAIETIATLVQGPETH
ncbi:MAG: hypothetical protein GX868_00015 [Actinobacteria bacterium]|nr:hypothetical protein [Actinomycetota bacterium]